MMEYKIRRRKQKDCYDIAHIVTVAWQEIYKGFNIKTNQTNNRLLLLVFYYIILIINKMEVVMENKVAIIGIILKNRNNVEVLNRTLSDYGDYIIGRMGLPYKEKNVNIISVVIDAPTDVLNELNKKIGKIEGISVI